MHVVLTILIPLSLDDSLAEETLGEEATLRLIRRLSWELDK
jgi:hypothetical protein